MKKSNREPKYQYLDLLRMGNLLLMGKTVLSPGPFAGIEGSRQPSA
jgi:hypothetical protein